MNVFNPPPVVSEFHPYGNYKITMHEKEKDSGYYSIVCNAFGSETIIDYRTTNRDESFFQISIETHTPGKRTHTVSMEVESGFTFRQDFSLQLMSKIKKTKKVN